MKALFAVSELAPWVKTGGLGDVASSLPVALRRIGIDVRILVPFYPALRTAFAEAPVVARLDAPGGKLPAAVLRKALTADGVPLLLIDCASCYERPGTPYLDADGAPWPDNHVRFALLSRVAAWLGSAACTLDWHCDIVHCNDWQSGLAPAYLRFLPGASARSLITIHNLAFQGLFDPPALEDTGLPAHSWGIDGVEFYGRLSFLKAALRCADAITTVSPMYAKEIQTDQQGMGMAGLLRERADSLVGILNGIDADVWNPATDTAIAERYDSERLDLKRVNKAALQQELGLPMREDIPLLGVVGRLTGQKGLDLLPQIGAALAGLPVQMAILGSGECALEGALVDLARQHPGSFATVIGFDEALAHRIEAGADIFLMPSRFEPCGLNQMYSLRYGTPPVVRATGGLADSVVDCNPETLFAGIANGFVFAEASGEALLAAIRRATATWGNQDIWRRLQRTGMSTDFSWTKPAQRYTDVYRAIIGRELGRSEG
jgi:starch synthase